MNIHICIIHIISVYCVSKTTTLMSIHKYIYIYVYVYIYIHIYISYSSLNIIGNGSTLRARPPRGILQPSNISTGAEILRLRLRKTEGILCYRLV